MMEYKYGPWKIWNGGEQPVAGDVLVQVQVRNETRYAAERDDPELAENWSWKWHNDELDSIAYREVIQPKRETVRIGVTRTLLPIRLHDCLPYHGNTPFIAFEVVDDEIDFSTPPKWEKSE